MRRLDEISFDFSMNQILRYHRSVATWKKTTRKWPMKSSNCARGFKWLNLLFFNICGWHKKRDNSCWFPKCEAIAQRRKRDCVTEISYWYHLYNNSSVKSLHIHLGNLTSVVHIWGQIRCKIFSWKTREELGNNGPNFFQAATQFSWSWQF